MATIDKLVCTWSGFVGAPGYSVFYATPGNLVRDDVAAFFQAIGPMLPDDVTVTIPAIGDSFDDATGTMVGAWSAGTTTVVNGASSGSYAAPAGVCVSWLTGGIVRGRRVQGRTFLVPMAGTVFATDGTLDSANKANIDGAAAALVAAAGGNLLVWSRPVAGAGGSSHAVVDHRVADRAAVLRSRRA